MSGDGWSRRTAGFTLIEALIASVILLLTVIATSMALTSGRQHSLEAQDAMQSALSADALMAQILTSDYVDLDKWDGHDESPGSMTTAATAAYPGTYYRIGRRASVAEKTYEIDDLGVKIQGMEIVVDAYNVENRVLCTLTRFIPEPTS